MASRNNYVPVNFIDKLLRNSPYEFKKENGIWYKRIKSTRNRNVWQEIVFSENSGAIDNTEIY